VNDEATAKTLGFTSLLTLLAALYLADAADAASVARQCRKACGDEIAACVGAGGLCAGVPQAVLDARSKWPPAPTHAAISSPHAFRHCRATEAASARRRDTAPRAA